MKDLAFETKFEGGPLEEEAACMYSMSQESVTDKYMDLAVF